MFLQTKEAAIKALVEIDDQGGKNKFSYKFIILKYIIIVWVGVLI